MAIQSYNLHEILSPKDFGQDERLIAHHLILAQKYDATIVWLGEHPEYLSTQATRFLLTPLHLCAMVGDLMTAAYLLAQDSVCLDAQDIRKWTPLHHAALHADPKMLELFLAADKAKVSAALALKNENNGTYEDLRRMAFPSPVPEAAQVFYCSAEEGMILGTAGDFQGMTGGLFVNSTQANPLFFMEEWVSPTCVAGSFLQFPQIEQEYESYLPKPSRLCLGALKTGHGVFASEEIEEGAILVEYCGEAIHGENKSSYRMPLCDGGNMRNLGPMINDGPPNCVDFPVFNFKGFPLIHVFKAIRTIGTGEQILWNYGSGHPVKKEKYTIFSQSSAEQWFREHPIADQYSACIAAFKNEDWIAYRKHLTPLHYLLGTQSFQILILVKRILGVSDVVSLAKNSFFLETEKNIFVSQDVELNFEIVTEFFEMCSVCSNPVEAEKAAVSLVEYLFAQLTVSSVVKLLSSITTNNPLPRRLFKQILNGNTSQKIPLVILGRQIEEIDFLYAGFCKNPNDLALTGQFAAALVAFKSPIASLILSKNYIGPILKSEITKTQYAELLSCHGLEAYLEDLEIL